MWLTLPTKNHPTGASIGLAWAGCGVAPDLVRLLRDEKAQPKDRTQTQRELLMSAAPQKRKRRVPHKPRAPKLERDFKAERVGGL
jgi:hypothetical protein